MITSIAAAVVVLGFLILFHELGHFVVAKRAGVRKDDVIVAFDGQEGRMTESDVIGRTVQRRWPGDEVAIAVVRNGERKTLTIRLQ